MSSDSTLATVRAKLNAALASWLPDGWRQVPHIEKLPAAFRAPILATEFTGINVADGTRLPMGWAFCDFDLLIVIPSTDDAKGEDEVDAAVLELIVAIDQLDGSVVWDQAKKERLDTGQLYWRVSLSVITSTR